MIRCHLSLLSHILFSLQVTLDESHFTSETSRTQQSALDSLWESVHELFIFKTLLIWS